MRRVKNEDFGSYQMVKKVDKKLNRLKVAEALSFIGTLPFRMVGGAIGLASLVTLPVLIPTLLGVEMLKEGDHVFTKVAGGTLAGLFGLAYIATAGPILLAAELVSLPVTISDKLNNNKAVKELLNHSIVMQSVSENAPESSKYLTNLTNPQYDTIYEMDNL